MDHTEAGWREAIHEDWQGFLAKAAQFDGTVDSFHAVNQTLGYNLAKAVGPLIQDITRLEREAAQLNTLIQTMHTRAKTQDERLDKANVQTETMAKRIKELETLYDETTKKA
jgi:methyl-accepting chemotaxis protein